MRLARKKKNTPYLMDSPFRCFFHREVIHPVFSRRGKCILFSNGNVQEAEKLVFLLHHGSQLPLGGGCLLQLQLLLRRTCWMVKLLCTTPTIPCLFSKTPIDVENKCLQQKRWLKYFIFYIIEHTAVCFKSL